MPTALPIVDNHEIRLLFIQITTIEASDLPITQKYTICRHFPKESLKKIRSDAWLRDNVSLSIS